MEGSVLICPELETLSGIAPSGTQKRTASNRPLYAFPVFFRKTVQPGDRLFWVDPPGDPREVELREVELREVAVRYGFRDSTARAAMVHHDQSEHFHRDSFHSAASSRFRPERSQTVSSSRL